MALIDPQDRKRLDIPNESDQWVEVRPLTARDFAILQKDAGDRTPADLGLAILVRAVTAWSYPVELTPENIDRLDFETYEWLRGEVSMSGGRDDEEKKDSNSPSSPTTDPEVESSLPSLGT